MRSLLTRLAALGVFAATVAGCSWGGGGTNLPASAFPNGAGGNGGGQLTNVTTPTGVNTTLTVPANTLAPTALFFTTTAPFSGFNVAATSVATAATFAQDPSPTNLPPSNSTGAFVYPAPPTLSDAITFQATQASQNPTLLKGPTAPSLVVNYSTPQVSTPVTLSTIVVHASLTGGGAPDYTGASLGLELVGGSGASAYDVRVNCGILTNKVATYNCGPLPSYGQVQTTATGGFVPQQSVPPTFPAFPNPVNPTATGAYTGIVPTIYAVVTYGAALPTGPTTLNIGYVYAKQ